MEKVPVCHKSARSSNFLLKSNRTALMLSVTLGHLETTKILLSHGANVNVINRGGWTVVQEAVSTGDPELVEVQTIGSLDKKKKKY